MSLSSTYSKIALAIIPIAAPSLYLLYLHRSLSSSVKCFTEAGSSSNNIPLPSEILSDASNYVVVHEAASKAIPTAEIPNFKFSSPDELLTTYLRTNMISFSYLPQSYLIKYLCKSASARKTFDISYIQALEFVPGDLVCGAYRVIRRSPTRVHLALSPDKSYQGPVVQGMLAIGVEEKGAQTVFLNDTFMWRKKDEKPVLLESTVGQWMHQLTAKWLVNSGVNKMIAVEKKYVQGTKEGNMD